MSLTHAHQIEQWSPDRLRSHPENVTIFGDPEESNRYEETLASIKANGIEEPLVVRADGTVLSGHVRLHCANAIGLKTVPVRVAAPFVDYHTEVKFLIRANTDRRMLTPGEIALALRRLKEIPREHGGAKAPMGRPKKSATSGTLSGSTRDSAAAAVGVSRHVADACEKVFGTEGVPEDFKAAVNTKKIAVTTAAKAVRSEEKRQGGAIKSPAALSSLVRPRETPRETVEPGETHEQRVAKAAAKYADLYARMVRAYREVDDVLTRMPLGSVLGPSEHHEYAALVRDLALRAWREIEAVQGPTNTGRQMALTVIQGGK